jgi:hypothetical protein
MVYKTPRVSDGVLGDDRSQELCILLGETPALLGNIFCYGEAQYGL